VKMAYLTNITQTKEEKTKKLTLLEEEI